MASQEDFNIKDMTPPVIDLDKLYNSTLNIREELDYIARENGFGSMSTINSLVLRGFNYLRHGQQLVHTNRDNMGYAFFTRPILNLTYDNLSASRTLALLRNAGEKTIQRYVRATLDPWWQNGMNNKRNHNGYAQDSQRTADMNDSQTPLVDPYNPFIPLLTNTVVNLSGWKDIAINDYTSPAGIHGEQTIMADGFYYVTGAWEMSSSFRNIEGDPISLLFQTWIQYIIECRQEYQMNPYPCFVEEREFDYNSRIYRFIMDHTKTYIQKYAATIAFPMSVPYGNQFNMDTSKNFIDANGEISVTWKCVGADYNDPVLFYEFNKLVSLYCPDLTIEYESYDHVNNKLSVVGKDRWKKLLPHEKLKGIYLAIPLINYVTGELEWWINDEHYNKYILTTRPKVLKSTRISRTYAEDGTYEDTSVDAGDSITTMANFGNYA